LIAGLLGSAYTPGQMTYDLRRLRLNGLIRRLLHTNRYVLTADSIRITVFYTKVYNRLLIPLTAADQAQAPADLRAALAAITRHVDDYANRARLPRAARNLMHKRPQAHDQRSLGPNFPGWAATALRRGVAHARPP
jgi:hypothetical protein